MALDVDEKVEPLEVAVGGLVLARQVEVLAERAAHAEEDRVVAASEERVEREVAPEAAVEEVLAAHALDRGRLRLEKRVRQTVGGNAEASHAARARMLFINVDHVAAAKQMVGAVDAGGTRADHGDALRDGRGLHALVPEERLDRLAAVVGRIALEVLDRDGAVDVVARAGRLAGAHAHAAAGADERIMAQQHARGELGVAVADVVDVARHVHLRGTGLNAGGRRHADEVALGGGHDGRVDEKLGKVLERAENGLGRREAYAAEARLLHLKGNVADALPVDFGSPALAGGFKRLDDHHAARTARRAAAAGELPDALVIGKQHVRERHAIVEHQEALGTGKARNGIAAVEGEEFAQRKALGRLSVDRAAVVVRASLPDAVNQLVHMKTSSQAGFGRARLFMRGPGVSA